MMFVITERCALYFMLLVSNRIRLRILNALHLDQAAGEKVAVCNISPVLFWVDSVLVHLTG